MRAHKVWKFPDNIDTDVIIAARYLNTSDPSYLASHVMEDFDKDFSKKISAGDIIVAGENFGCGSSREHAPIAIKAAGIDVVIAKSFARIFYRNSFNTGLLILECADTDKISGGDNLSVDLNAGIIKNESKNESYTFAPIPEFMQELVRAGGLINYAKKSLNLE